MMPVATMRDRAIFEGSGGEGSDQDIPSLPFLL